MDPTAANDYSLWYKFTSDSHHNFAEILLRLPHSDEQGQYILYKYGFPLQSKHGLWIPKSNFAMPPDSEHVGFGLVLPAHSKDVQKICGSISSQFHTSVTTPQDCVDFLIKSLIAANLLSVGALHSFWYSSQGPEHPQTVSAYKTTKNEMRMAGFYMEWTGKVWQPTVIREGINRRDGSKCIVERDDTDSFWKPICCRCHERGECWKPQGENQSYMYQFQHKGR